MLRRRSASVAALCFLPACALADRIEVPLEVKTHNVFTDTNASKRTCVAGNIEEKSGELMSLPLPPLAPGAYRLHARLKVSHTCVQATSRLTFALRVGSPDGLLGGRLMRIVEFERPRQYQECLVPMVVRRPVAEARLSVGWQWDQTLDPESGRRKLTDLRMPSVTNLEADIADAPKTSLSSEALALERTLSELPYHLACDAVWLERTGEAVIEDLWTDRSRYAPGATARVRGRIVNSSAAPRAWTVRAERMDELDSAGVVALTNADVRAGQTAAFELEFPVGSRLWGHEIRCSLLDATQAVVATAATPFTVHSNLWAVLIGGRTMDHTDYRAGLIGASPRRGEGDDAYRLATEVEFVFWAPDDFGGLTPTNHYWSGQMRRQNGAESTRRLVEHFHSRGVGCAVYAKTCTAGGKAGYELMRRHPEWLTPSFFDVAQLDRWDRSQRLSCWPMLNVNVAADDAYRHHALEIIASQREFGWDAVRYDSAMNDPAAPRHFGMVKEMVNAACPGFQWGFNSGPPDRYAPGMFDLMCAGGGLIMEERNVHASMDGWTYGAYAERHVAWRQWVHLRGGHLAFCPFESELVNDAIFQEILPLCARAHQAWDPTQGQVAGADYGRFALRYAGQLWDLSYEAPTNAATFVDWGPAATNLFLWDRYVYVRSTGPDRRELILHMVNRPPPRVGGSADCWVPPPLEGTTCRLRLPGGAAAGPVLCLSPEREPERQELASRQEGDTLVFAVPALRFWNMLVIPLAGKGRWP